ncbi:ROK family protein [Nocardioides dubius]|uniref:ROK family glucokinase n=1 Tax=Nocardioides dubius TaxID=317019 RepID=A0ABP4E9R1_9ACTN
MSAVVGIDVGGTKVLAGVVEGGEVLATSRGETPGRRVTEQAIEDALSEALAEVADGRRVRAVGVAAAGFVDRSGDRVRFAPHLPWLDAPVRQRLEDRWQLPVVIENDATAAAHAEVALGAARGAETALVVNLGTGIGGAAAIGGRVLRGHNGMAGEFGHMVVVPGGAPCECGGAGCWEQYASGNALERVARERMAGRPTLLAEMCQGDPARLRGPMVTEAAELGDLVALEAFATVGEWLGVGLANLTAAYDPEVVVVGGGVATAGERLLTPARRVLERTVVGAGHRELPRVVPAQLGTRAGLIGAADLALRALRAGR